MGRERSKRYWEERRRIADGPVEYFVVPRNPPGFGVGVPEEEVSPLETGQTYFDDPFYTVLPPPPLGRYDPTFPQWLGVKTAARKRIEACPVRAETPECDAAREAYFEAARQYSRVLDYHYGLRRFQDGINGIAQQDVKVERQDAEDE